MVDGADIDVVSLHRPINVMRSPSSPRYCTWGQMVLSCASTGPDPRARYGACFVSSVTPVWLLSCATLPVEPEFARSCLGYCALVKSSELCQRAVVSEHQTAARWSLISTLITEIRYPWCVVESSTSPLTGYMWSCRGKKASEYNQPLHLGCSEMNVLCALFQADS